MYYYGNKIIIKKFFNSVFKFRNEKFLGYKIFFYDYADFKSLFYEIFAAKSYFLDIQKKRPVIVDGGSNIGMSVLFFKTFYPDSKIICFEPQRLTFKLLVKNIKYNHLNNVYPYNLALSDNEEPIKVYSSDKYSSCNATILKNMSKSFKKTYDEEVKAVQLSNFIEEDIDILKLDVEGAEGKIIKELDVNKKIHKIKNIIMEYHNDLDENNDITEILTILKKNKFNVEIESIKYPPISFYKNKHYTLILFAHKE